jgi:hypothetical protein
MTDTKQNKSKHLDDSLAYAKNQTGLAAEDPLAAIKTMRLQQLAVCRLKTAAEMQAMADQLAKSDEDTAS